MKTPLADQMRPNNLEDIIGQEHITGPNKIVQKIVESNQPTNLILWGPPGTGKTTLARLIADKADADFVELSAVKSGKADVMKVIDQAGVSRRLGNKTILFVDEIHRFNKAQQDAFLPHLEDGTIYIIGATTENPSFEVIPPLLSRSRVLILNPLKTQDIVYVLKRAAKEIKLSRSNLPLPVIKRIAEISDGDARFALGTLELAIQLSDGHTTLEDVDAAAQKKLPAHDKNGENHYNIISAFIKSLRGSDENASIYYLARMLQAGEDPKFIARRMVVFASEDVGMAAPAALNLAVSTFLAVERIGMPECEYNLYHCTIVLAKTKKSREVTDAMNKAKNLASNTHSLPVPLHIRNAPTRLMKNLGYGKDNKWTSGFEHPKGFLPREISNVEFFD